MDNEVMIKETTKKNKFLVVSVIVIILSIAIVGVVIWMNSASEKTISISEGDLRLDPYYENMESDLNVSDVERFYNVDFGNGYFVYAIEERYDDKGRPVYIANYDNLGNSIIGDDFTKYMANYYEDVDQKKRDIYYNYRNKEGLITPILVYEYNKDGDICFKGKYDENGDLLASDQYSLFKSKKYEDGSGKICVFYYKKNSESDGYIERRVNEYDSLGNMILDVNYDENGEIKRANIYGKYVGKYNKKGVLKEKKYDKYMFDNGNYVHESVEKFNRHGQMKFQAFYDENGELTVGNFYSLCKRSFYPFINVSWKDYWEDYVYDDGTVAAVREQYMDVFGRLILHNNFDENGNLVICGDHAKCYTEYYNLSNRKKRKVFFQYKYDDGTIVAKKEITYSESGRIKTERNYDDEDNLIVGENFSMRETEYYKRTNRIKK